MEETTLEKLLELIKKDCPPNKSWSVAVRTYATAQQIYIKQLLSLDELHDKAYEKVQQYFNSKSQ